MLAAMAVGANVSELCREFGISRNNGYKWIRRYKDEGTPGLNDRSKRPLTQAGTSGETVLRLIELRRQYPKWGPKKLRFSCSANQIRQGSPSPKTIARILDRAGEPRIRKARRRLRLVLRQHQKLDVGAPNDVWTVDFKGWVANRRRQALRTIDGPGCLQPLCALPPNARLHERCCCKARIRAAFQGFWPPQGHSGRQRRPLRLHERPSWTEPPFCMVDVPGDPGFVQSTRSSPGQRIA